MFDDALDVEEIGVAPVAAPVIGCGESRPRQRRRRASRRRARSACRFRTAARRAADGGDCGSTASTRPGNRLGRITANFSDSGLASATGALAFEERLGSRRFDEREGDRFGEAHAEQRRRARVVARDARVGRRRRLLRRRGSRRQMLEAVVTADFFDQVHRPMHVDAPGRAVTVPASRSCGSGLELRNTEAERRQIRSTSSSGHVHAEQARDARLRRGASSVG